MGRTCLKLFLSFLIFFQLFFATNTVASSSNSNNLSIATASNFRPVLEQLSEAFSQQYNNEEKNYQINISSASSGIIYAQLLQGAPFQLFFSANASYPEKLVDSGHGVVETLTTYAIGKLILVSRNKDDGSEGQDLIENNETPGQILSKAKRIAIANPRTAPYGMAAMEILESKGNAEAFRSKLVVGNNIAQAWQFFHSGHADVAIVSASLLASSEQSELREWVILKEAGLKNTGLKKKTGLNQLMLDKKGLLVIDLSSYLKHPVRQSLIATKPVSQLTQQFLDFMNTATAKKIIVDGGYLLPEMLVPEMLVPKMVPVPAPKVTTGLEPLIN